MAEESNAFGGTSIPGIPVNGTAGGRVTQISGDVLFAGNVEIRAGRFIAATEDSATVEPTDANFSGCFMSAEGETFGSDTYNIGGVNAGVLQFGLDATDGKAYFMGGAAVMDDGGLNLSGLGSLINFEATYETETRNASIKMQVPAGGTAPALTIESYSPGDVTWGSELTTNGDFAASDLSGWTQTDGSTTEVAAVFAYGNDGAIAPHARCSLTSVDAGSGTLAFSNSVSVDAGSIYRIDYSGALIASHLTAGYSTYSVYFLAEWYDVSSVLVRTDVLYIFRFGDGTYFGATPLIIAPTGATSLKFNFSMELATTAAGEYITIDVGALSIKKGSSVIQTYTALFNPEFTVSGGATIDTLSTDLITLTEGADPSSPSAGYRALYAKSDGVYQKVSGGTVSRLALASEIPTLTYPKRFAVMGDEITTAVTTQFNALAIELYAGYWSPVVANANNGDEYTFSIFVAAGTYTFYHLAAKGAVVANIDWYVDGSTVATGRSWYNASNVVFTDSFSVTIATSGYHTVKLKANGKNASSSDYAIRITKIWGKQATD